MLQQPSIADRIAGKRIRTGANCPFLLDDPNRVFHVEQGHLNLFGAETVGDEVASRSPFVARIGAGETAFCASIRPPARAGETGSGLVAVPSQEAVLIEGRLEVLASPQGFDLDTLIWIDNWIYRLSEFLIQGPGPPPRNAALLEAEPAVAYPKGSAVSAHHSDIVWVTVDQPTRFTGRADLEIPAGAMQPLSERTWLALDADSRVTAVQTPSAYIHKELWPALEAHNRLVLEVVEKTREERAEAVKSRYRVSGRIQKEARTGSFLELGSVLGAEEPVHTPPAEARTALRAAVQIVAESLDAEFEVPAGLTEARDPLEAIPQLAAAGGLRARRVRLEEGWWKRDGPSFVGIGENREPIAVLAGDAGGFRVVDPATHESKPVGAEAGRAIFRFGFMLYPTLPHRIRGGMDALRLTLRRRRRDLKIVLVMALLGALTALVTPVLSGKLLAEVIPRVDTSLWIAMLAALLVAALGTAVFEVVRALAMLRVEGRADEQLQASVWSRVLSLPVPFFRRFTAGDLADRANGISLIRQLITGATTAAVISGIFSVFSLALLFYYSWKLALLALGFVSLLAALSYFSTRRQLEHLRVAFTEQGAIDGMVFQLISGLSKLRLAGAEGFALARWAERFAEQKRKTLAARRWGAAQSVVNSMFGPLATLGIFAFIWYSIIEDNSQPDFDLAAFLSFNAAFGQFAGAATGLTGAVSAVVSAVPLFERVRPILEAAPERPDGGAHLRHLVGDIEFSQVSFRYLPKAPNALDRVSFRISAGDYVAFVGPSGSGKSTVYRILLGFEQPDSGSVFFDDHDLLTLDLSSLRNRMGVVMQDGQLVAASVFKNISSSAPISMEEAWEAAELAGIAEDIRAMPMGMHTVLSEGVPALSGGQKQRLLIARAFARKPRILLFDEATSALDNRTQGIVQESLAKLNSTRIVIAHRLSTVQAVDRIHVLEGGRIVESGKYHELMAKGGAFAKLARRQLVSDEGRSA